MYPKSGVSLCLLLSPYVMVLCSCAHAALPNSNSAITYRLEGVRPNPLEPPLRTPLIVRAAVSESLPIVKGWVGDARITSLWNSGYSGVIVKQQFVRHEKYTGRDDFIQLVDNSIKKIPIPRVNVDTPYLSGTVEDAIYDVIIGNVPGAKSPYQADSDIHTAAEVTRPKQI